MSLAAHDPGTDRPGRSGQAHGRLGNGAQKHPVCDHHGGVSIMGGITAAEIRTLVAENSALAGEAIEVCAYLTVSDWAAAKVDSRLTDPASAIFKKQEGGGRFSSSAHSWSRRG